MLGIELSCCWIKPDYSRTLESSFRTLFPHFRYVFAGHTDLYFILLKRNHAILIWSLFNKDYFRFWNTGSRYSFDLIFFWFRLDLELLYEIICYFPNKKFIYCQGRNKKLSSIPSAFYWAVLTVNLKLLIIPTHSS